MWIIAKILVGWPQRQYGLAVSWVSQNGQQFMYNSFIQTTLRWCHLGIFSFSDSFKIMFLSDGSRFIFSYAIVDIVFSINKLKKRVNAQIRVFIFFRAHKSNNLLGGFSIN